MKELFDKWSRTGIKFPYAFDATTKKASVSLLFVYITFIFAVISNIILHFNEHVFTATVTVLIFWAVAMIFYLLRRLTKTKIDLDDKSISLEGDDKDE
jgi:hypothetical protein